MTITKCKINKIYELADKGITIEQIVRVTHTARSTIKKYLKKDPLKKNQQ